MGQRAGRLAWVVGAVFLFCASPASAAPFLTVPGNHTLTLVSSDAVNLKQVDGLTIDSFGNLYAAREVSGSTGGVSIINLDTGVASNLVSGISRSDQVQIHSSGALYVTSESGATSTTNRLYRVDITYDGFNRPTGGVATSLTTGPSGINNPEGLAELTTTGAFGNAGDLFIAEDATPGRILRVDPTTGTTTIWIDTGTGLRRPEGLAFGDFGGAVAEALYVAETLDGNILKIDEFGTVSLFGSPGQVGMIAPDNVQFGADGFMYISEDRGAGNGRIIRVASDGTHSVFAAGFTFPQGMVFDANGDMYIAEQGTASVWKVTFVPEPTTLLLLIGGLTAVASAARKKGA